MSGPALYRHKPTTVEAMQFTAETAGDVHAWLSREGADFQMTRTHLLISTTQGDSRDIEAGGWVIRRRVNDPFEEYEFYPVEAEVMDDYEPADPDHVMPVRGEDVRPS